MNNVPRFHIFGASGLLGSAMVSVCESSGRKYTPYSHSGFNSICFDISTSDFQIFSNRISANDFIINLAAVAQPSIVKINKEKANMVNVVGNSRLTNFAADVGCKYFFMSSVEVFDGSKWLLNEDAAKCPLNEYGRQKAQAEDNIQNHGHNNYVIGRTSWNVSSTNKGRCLVPFMIKALECDDAKMATDNIFTIASASETAMNIIRACESNLKGIVHIASPAPISRYDIATIIIQSFKAKLLNCQPCLFSDLIFQEPRSRLNVLDVSRSIREFEAEYSEPEKIISARINELNTLNQRLNLV